MQEDLSIISIIGPAMREGKLADEVIFDVGPLPTPAFWKRGIRIYHKRIHFRILTLLESNMKLYTKNDMIR